MFFAHEPEVLVVGAGPVGLLSALMLAERGVAAEVIEEEPRAGAHSHAVTLHPQTLRLLDEVGVASELVNLGYRVPTTAIWDHERELSLLRFDEAHTAFPYLLVLPRGVLEHVLLGKLAARRVPVHFGYRLADVEQTATGLVATIEQLGVDSGGYGYADALYVVDRIRHRRPRYLIGADGHHSTVRRRLGIEVRPTGAPEAYAMIELDRGYTGGEARVVLGEGTTDVVWPLPGGRCRWTLQLDATEGPQHDSPHLPVGGRAWREVDDARIEQILRERAPWFVRRGDTTFTAQVRFEPALAERFGSGRAWLAGDAAHVSGPIGVHSVNVGMQEAHDLASRIARAIRSDNSPRLLDHYHEEQTSLWRQLFSLDEAPRTTALTEPWVSASSERILRCLPASGPELPHLAGHLGLSLAH